MDKQREAFDKWLRQYHADHFGEESTVEDYSWDVWKAAQQAQWLPIETAPKEELRDLIVFNGAVMHGQWWEGYWIDSMQEYMNPQPSHWMPLPPEPKK